MADRRLRCVVPFCRCTRGDRKADPLPLDITGMEWICQKHWPLVPRATKARRRQLDKRVKRISAAWHRDHAAGYRRRPYAGWWTLHAQAVAAAHFGWAACRNAAIERAAGL